MSEPLPGRLGLPCCWGGPRLCVVHGECDDKGGKTQNWVFTYYLMTRKLGLPSSVPSAISPSISPITSQSSLPPSWIEYGYNGLYCGSYDLHTRHGKRDVETCQSLCLASSACNTVGVVHDCVLYMGCVMTKEGKKQSWGFTYYFLMPLSWIYYGYSGNCGSYDSYTWHVTRDVETCQSLCLADSACNAVGVSHGYVLYMGCVMTKEGKTQNWGSTYYFNTSKLGLPSNAPSAIYPSISPITSPSSLPPSWIEYGYNGRYCSSYNLHTRHGTRDVETCQSLCLANSACNAARVGHECVLYIVCAVTKEGKKQNWGSTYYFLPRSLCILGRRNERGISLTAALGGKT